jgi:formylglycine-generating enzyme required for sulfatase activity
MSAEARALLRELQMVSIPGGTFEMGDTMGDGKPNERPIHRVSVPPFRLGKYEVTVGQFRKFIAATGYRTEAERNVEALLPWAIEGCGIIDPASHKPVYRAGLQWDSPGFAQDDTHPVVCVSWNDVQQFIRWLNRESGRRFRLPSEAEWEYAARGKTTGSFYWGAAADKSCAYANGADLQPPPSGERGWDVRLNCNDGYYFTSPVGHYAPNAFGLYDILGNAREWNEDCAHDDYVGAPTDGSPWLTGNCNRRMARGTSLQGSLRVAERGHGTLPARDFEFGFRLAEDK